MGLLSRRRIRLPRVARTGVIGVTLLATVAGLATSRAARADDPPPATVPTPAVPSPDPAPPKTTPRPPQVSRAPTYHAPAAAAPPVSVSPVRPTVASTPTKRKPIPARPRKRPVAQKALLPKAVFVGPVRAVNVAHTFPAKPSGSLNLAALVIVLGLCAAISCFTIALVPATSVKWRPVAMFLSERQFDVTIVGLGLLVAAACTFLWTGGP